MTDPRSLDYDFKLHDAYIAFSAEIVRLALLSPVLISFLLVFAGTTPKVEEFAKLLRPAHCSLALGFIAMAIAVCLGLLHRYFATDFMATRVEYLRGLAKGEPVAEGGDSEEAGVVSLVLKREARQRLRLASACLFGGGAALFAGAALLLLSVYGVIFAHPG